MIACFPITDTSRLTGGKKGAVIFDTVMGTFFQSPVFFDFLGDSRRILFQDRSDVLKGRMVS